MTTNEGAQQALAALLNDLQKTGDWAKGQLPGVLHELIRWDILTDTVWITLALVWCLLFPLVVWPKVAETFDLHSRKEASIANFMIGIVGAGCFAVAAISLFVNIADLIQVLVAPRVWLIQYAASLLHGGK